MSQLIIPLHKRVPIGASLLDQHLPGWYNLIDTDTFHMSDVRYCVLGQCYGHYMDGVHTLKISYHAERFGFNLFPYETSELMRHLSVDSPKYVMTYWNSLWLLEISMRYPPYPLPEEEGSTSAVAH